MTTLQLKGGNVFSFEDYVISKYEPVICDRPSACAICSKPASTAYRLNGNTLISHKECLSLLLLYNVIRFVDLNWDSVQSGKSAGPVSLDPLFDITRIWDLIKIDGFKCYICGTDSAYLKCSVERCTNYLHIQCCENGNIIEYTADKRPNFRFILCHNHVKLDAINLVKCQLLSKLSLFVALFEFQINKTTKVFNQTLKDNESNMAVFESNLLLNGRLSGKIKGGASISTRSVCPTMNIEAINSNTQRSTSIRSTSTSDFLPVPYTQQIVTLMIEYNAMKRQKNTKKLEWWHYDIMFSRVSLDFFKYGDNAHLNNDLQSVFDITHLPYSITCLKRLPLNVEYTVQYIANIIGRHVKFSTQCAFINSSILNQHDGDKPYISNNMSSKIESNTIDCSNNSRRKSRFVLVNIGSKAVWFSCVLLKNVNESGSYSNQIVLLDYIPITVLEFEYLRRILRCNMIENNRTGSIPLFHLHPSSLYLKDTNDVQKEVNLSGFTWEVEPTMYKDFLDAVKAKSSKTFAYNLFNAADTLEYANNLNISLAKNSSKHSFVTKQSVSLLLTLKTINSTIQHHKQLLNDRIRLDELHNKRRHFDIELVEQFKQASSCMHRWSHFKRTFVQCIENMNNAMQNALEYEPALVANQPVVDNNVETVNIKEYCSVCLAAELSHKHALHQCGRCFMRVHHRCYMSNRSLSSNEATRQQTMKQDDPLPVWLCEACEYEKNLNPKSTMNCNTAICCVCCSSGGALKRVATSGLISSRGQTAATMWVHLHCAVMLMPGVYCTDWYALSMWNLDSLAFNGKYPCDICGVIGGVLVKCGHSDCVSMFHPTCAWLGGAHVNYSIIHNASIKYGMLPTEFQWKDIFPAICLSVSCINHSIQAFNRRIIEDQCRIRCEAYTHYLRCPDSFAKHKMRNRPLELPLKPTYSPVTITLQGPVRSPLIKVKVPVDMFEYEQMKSQDFVPKVMPMLIPTMPKVNDMHLSIQQPFSFGAEYPRSVSLETPRYGISTITGFLARNPNICNVPRKTIPNEQRMQHQHGIATYNGSVMLPNIQINGYPNGYNPMPIYFNQKPWNPTMTTDYQFKPMTQVVMNQSGKNKQILYRGSKQTV